MSKKKKKIHSINGKSSHASPAVRSTESDHAKRSIVTERSNPAMPDQLSNAQSDKTHDHLSDGISSDKPNEIFRNATVDTPQEVPNRTESKTVAADTNVPQRTESLGKRWLRSAGSLKWAVTLLSLYAVVVAWATLVDNEYGATAVAWGIYRSGWFAVLNLLLGLNVLCSALVRFPWKRRHIGFLMTHAGILMLLIGSAMTWFGGIDGVIGVFEGQTSNRLVTDAKQFTITVEPLGVDSAKVDSAKSVRYEKSFTPGPFSWAMLGRGELSDQSGNNREQNQKTMKTEAIPTWAKSATQTPLALFPWQVGTTAGPSTLYHDDTISVEIVDWLANVELVPLTPLAVTFDLRSADERTKTIPQDETNTTIVRLSGNPRAMMRGDGNVPARVPLPTRTAKTADNATNGHDATNGRESTSDSAKNRASIDDSEGFVTYRVAESTAEVAAFLNPISQSDRESTTFGPQGVLQLFVAGESQLFSVDTLTVGQRLPLARTGLTAIFEGRNTGMDHLRLRIVSDATQDETPNAKDAGNTKDTEKNTVSQGVTMRLFARYPDFNLNDTADDVFGYWWIPEVPMSVHDASTSTTDASSTAGSLSAQIIRDAQTAEAQAAEAAATASGNTTTENTNLVVPVSAEPFLEFLQYGDRLYARYVRDGWVRSAVVSSHSATSEATSSLMEGECGAVRWQVDLSKTPLGVAVTSGKMLHAVPFPTTSTENTSSQETSENLPKKVTRAEREAWIDGGLRAVKLQTKIHTNGSVSTDERWLLLDESEVARFRRMSAGTASDAALTQAGYSASIPESAGRWRLEYTPTDGTRRRMTLSLGSKDATLGFGVRLHEFDRRFNPGSTQASYYASRVDIVKPTTMESTESSMESTTIEPTVLTSDLLITMNEPAEVVETVALTEDVRESTAQSTTQSDTASITQTASTTSESPRGRAFRLFQTSWRGPWMPGSALFDTLVPVDSDASQLYMTVLSANYDPGSGWKYVGSLCLLVGMTTVFIGRTLRRKKTVPTPKNSDDSANSSDSSDSATDSSTHHLTSTTMPCHLLLPIILASILYGATLFANFPSYASDASNIPSNGSDPSAVIEKTPSESNSEDRKDSDRPNEVEPRHGSGYQKADWSEWERLPVLDRGRIRPLDTVARALADEVTDRERPIIAPPDHDSPNAQLARKLLFPNGKSRRFQPGEVLFGWLAAPDIWREIPIFRASYENLRANLKLPLRDAHGSRYRLTTITELTTNEAYGQWVDALINPHTAGHVAGSDNPEVRKQLETLYGHVGLVTQLGVDPSQPIPAKSLWSNETYHQYRQYDTFQTRVNRVMPIWGELAQNPLTTQLLTTPVDAQGRFVTDPRTKSSGDTSSDTPSQSTQRAGDAVQAAMMQLLALSLTPEEASQYQLQSREPDALLDLTEIDASLEVIQSVAQQTTNRLTDARAKYFASSQDSASQNQTASKSDAATDVPVTESEPKSVITESEPKLSDAQLIELRTMAFEFQMLARCAEEARFSLTEAPRGLRIVPSLCVEMLAERRPVEYENPVWLDLRTVLCGSDSLMADYPQTELTELRAAWRDAVHHYRTESPSREADFAAALHRFVGSIRTFGEAINDVRDQKIAQWNTLTNGNALENDTFSAPTVELARTGAWANPRTLGQVDTELTATTRYPERAAMGVEFLYNQSRPFMWTWAAALAAMLLFGTERLVPFGWYRRLVTLGGCGLLAASILFCVYGFVLRMLISRRAPVATLFETLIFTGLVAAIIGFGFTFWSVVDHGFRQAFLWCGCPWLVRVRRRLTEEHLSLGAAWCWFALRLMIGLAIFYLLAILPYSDAGRPILSLLPTGSSVGKMVAWNVGLVMLILSIWFVPQLLVAMLAACWTIGRSLRVHTWHTMLETIYQRRVAVIIGSVFAFVTTFLAYWFPETFNPGMDRLMPVLGDQFWLATHVLTITASYGAGAIGWGLGNIALLYYLFGTYRYSKTSDGTVSVSEPTVCETLAGYNYFSILIAVCLLTLGTILGALWADVSWGRFWAWDQKEVWSLITIFVYMVILHGRYTHWLGNFGMAAGAAVGAASILMAWFGVSFLLPGGLHSYGSLDAQSMKLPFIVAMVVLGLNLLLVAAAGIHLHAKKR